MAVAVIVVVVVVVSSLKCKIIELYMLAYQPSSTILQMLDLGGIVMGVE